MDQIVLRGSVNKAVIEECLRGQTRNKIQEILESVNGTMGKFDRNMLSMKLKHLDTLTAHLASVDEMIRIKVESYQETMSLLTGIPGILNSRKVMKRLVLRTPKRNKYLSAS